MNNKVPSFLVSLSILSLASLSANAADIATNTARMQAMDKITGRVSEIDVPVGGLANFGTFSILVRKCVTTSPEETPENTAFVDVVDNYQTNNPINIFKGWMFSSTPALNAVEHPIYDIWLLKCYNRPQESSQLLSEEQLSLRDTIPMVRHEAPSPKTDMDFDTSKDDEEDEEAKNTSLDDTPTNTDSTPDNIPLPEDNIITIDLTSTPNTPDEVLIEEDFVSEGEEPDFLDATPSDINNQHLPETNDTPVSE